MTRRMCAKERRGRCHEKTTSMRASCCSPAFHSVKTKQFEVVTPSLFPLSPSRFTTLWPCFLQCHNPPFCVRADVIFWNPFCKLFRCSLLPCEDPHEINAPARERHLTLLLCVMSSALPPHLLVCSLWIGSGKGCQLFSFTRWFVRPERKVAVTRLQIFVSAPVGLHDNFW